MLASKDLINDMPPKLVTTALPHTMLEVELRLGKENSASIQEVSDEEQQPLPLPVTGATLHRRS